MVASSSRDSVCSGGEGVLWCKCKKRPILLISSTEKNPERIFMKCDSCKFWKWLDEVEGYSMSKDGQKIAQDLAKMKDNLESVQSMINELKVNQENVLRMMNELKNHQVNVQGRVIQEADKFHRRQDECDFVQAAMVGGFSVLLVLCMLQK